MKLKVTFLNQLKMLTDLILISIPCFIFLLPLGITDFRLLCFLSIPYLLFFLLPVLFLHLNYLTENIETSFLLENHSITKRKGTEVFKYSSDEIKEIVFYMNGSRGSVKGTLAFSNYYYAKIELTDGKYFIITSLCSNKIDKILQENMNNVKITTKTVFYPML